MKNSVIVSELENLVFAHDKGHSKKNAKEAKEKKRKPRRYESQRDDGLKPRVELKAKPWERR